MIKNSQPFGKKFQKTVGGGDFILTHTVHANVVLRNAAKYFIAVVTIYANTNTILL